MKDIQEILRLQVVRAFNEYRDYVELSHTENKAKQKLLEEMKKVREENKEAPELKDFSFEIFLIDAYHKQDIKLLGTRFVNYMRLFKEIPDTELFDEEIEASYNYLKDRATEEQVFIVNQGKFKEIIKGFVEEKRKVFDEQNMFARVQDELEKLL